MFVACITLATTLLAANPQSSFPTQDLAAEARAMEVVRAMTAEGSSSKPSKIAFYGAKPGVIDHLQWGAYPKGATLTVTLLKARPNHYSIARPSWMNADSVLGLAASVPKVGVPRPDVDTPNWTEAGCYVDATPYQLSVRYFPSESDHPFDAARWASLNARAKELAEAALQALASEGFLKLPGKQEGLLLLTAQDQEGALLSNVEIALRVPGQPNPLIATTDANGSAKVAVPIAKADKDVVGSAQSIRFTSQSKVGGAPLYVAVPFTLEFTTAFTLPKNKDFRGNLALRFFVRPIYVKVEHTNSTDPVEECTVQLHTGDITGPAIIRVYQREGVKRNTIGQLVLRVPVTRTNGGTEATVYATTRIKDTVYEGWESVELPSNTVESAAVIVELLEATLDVQFRPYKNKIQTALTAAGFTKDEVTRIMAVQLRIGTRNNYLNGVIQLAQGSALRTSSENLLHEFGHLITDVIAADEPDGVGITHEVDEAVNLNAAWDEGRAHFFSTLLGQIAGLPGAKPIPRSPQGVDDCENRELFIQRALAEHFGNRGLYATPTQALAQFREVHRVGRQQLGRPPRTVIEFVQVLSGMGNATQAQKDNLERIRLEYGFGNP